MDLRNRHRGSCVISTLKLCTLTIWAASTMPWLTLNTSVKTEWVYKGRYWVGSLCLICCSSSNKVTCYSFRHSVWEVSQLPVVWASQVSSYFPSLVLPFPMRTPWCQNMDPSKIKWAPKFDLSRINIPRQRDECRNCTVFESMLVSCQRLFVFSVQWKNIRKEIEILHCS